MKIAALTSFVVLLLDVGMTEAANARFFTEAEKESILDSYNNQRKKAHVTYMNKVEWSPALECACKKWADTGRSGHSAGEFRQQAFRECGGVGDTGYGEIMGTEPFRDSAYGFSDSKGRSPGKSVLCSERENFAATHNEPQLLLPGYKLRPECKGGVGGHMAVSMMPGATEIGCSSNRDGDGLICILREPGDKVNLSRGKFPY
eukprot:Awhi_evm1s3757